MPPVDLIIPAVIVTVVAIGVIVVIRLESRDWNGGIAPSGEPWEQFDEDSQGGRGYKDPAGEDHIWISWPVDKRPK